LVDPKALSEGYARYDAVGMEHFIFEFMLTYARRVGRIRSGLNY